MDVITDQRHNPDTYLPIFVSTIGPKICLDPISRNTVCSTTISEKQCRWGYLYRKRFPSSVCAIKSKISREHCILMSFLMAQCSDSDLHVVVMTVCGKVLLLGKHTFNRIRYLQPSAYEIITKLRENTDIERFAYPTYLRLIYSTYI